MYRQFVAIAAIFLIVNSGFTVHARPVRIDKAECRPEDKADPLWIDQTHFFLSRQLRDMAVWFDRFFSDEYETDESAKSILRFINSLGKSTNTDAHYRTQFHAHFYLPNVNRRFRLILVGDKGEDVPERSQSTDESLRFYSFEHEEAEESSLYSAALQWIIQESDNSNLDFKLSARFRDHVNPYIKSRYRLKIPLSKRLLFRISETLFWYDGEGFGETTELDFERIINHATYLRLSSEATIPNTNDDIDEGIEWIERLDILFQMSSRKAISTGVGIRSITEPYVMLEDCWYEIHYYQNLYNSWLFFELIPAINWPRDEDGRAIPSIIFKLEMQFGD
ncbi:MAG: hypothetical protein ACMUIP_17985 [bacterium]